jgi:hypothetical protein
VGIESREIAEVRNRKKISRYADLEALLKGSAIEEEDEEE